MNMKKIIKAPLILIAIVALLCGSAFAYPILEITDGSATYTIDDSVDLTPEDGLVKFDGAIGSFNVAISIGTSKPMIGSEGYPKLDLFSVDVSGAAGDLTIKLTDTDFGPVNTPINGMYSLIGGTTDGNVSLATYIDSTNTAFGTETTMANLGIFSNGAFSDTVSWFDTSGILNSSFAMTIVANIHHGGAGEITSLDAELKPVPEPATMLLLGTGLIGLAGISRKKFIKK